MRTFNLVALLALGAPSQSSEVEWLVASADYEWSFPADHWSHQGYKTEWLYFTGHLASSEDPTKRFGYQFTVFRVGIVPSRPQLESNWTTRNVFMGHAAITDLASGRHIFSEVLYREVPLLAGFGQYPDSLIAWSTAAPGTKGRWTLRWNGDGFNFSMVDRPAGITIDLETRATRGPTFQGPNGFSRKGNGPSAASMYYSFTRMQTRGALEIDGANHTVTGVSWMDHEFGSNQLSEAQVGWDWFSLQLEDGRDLMLYQLRNEEGDVDFRHGTIVSEGGAPTFLAGDEWSLRPVDTWESAESKARYPARWSVTIPFAKLQFDVTPLLTAQENVSRLVDGLFYWEGGVEVRTSSGEVIGRGYVELTGYGDGSRPAL